MRTPSPFRDKHAFRALLASGALVTITTAGALVGLGLQTGEALRVFRHAGINVLAALGFVTAGPLAAVTAGLLHHLVVASGWGVLLSIVALTLQGLSRLVACVLLVPLYLYIVPRVIPPVFRIGHAVTSRDADLFPIAAALAVALLGGAWVAGASMRAEHDSR